MLTLEQIKPIHPSTLIPKMTTVEENKTEHQPEGDTKGLGRVSSSPAYDKVY
jgi:hypothetical protein